MTKFFINHPEARKTTDVSAAASRVQECRLFTALLESGWSLVANQEQAAAITWIQPYFPVSISQQIPKKFETIKIEIDHPAPRTTFGTVTRKLIFPRWLADVGVGGPRDIALSYSGFPTRERVEKLVSMHNDVLPEQKKIHLLPVLIAGKIGLLSWYFRGSSYRWSTRGRAISGKIVDPSYWELLHRSRAVYCPAGDFGWTYRFFESMLAGAMPVLDEPAPFAKGYHYHPANRPLPAVIDPKLLAENRSLALAEVTAKEDLVP